jgi:hypothetical protein
VWLPTDPRFALKAQVPFPPGTSPFHTLGAAYVTFVGFVKANVPGGVDALGGALSDPALARFLAQPFSGSRNYDLVPLPYLGTAAARLRGVTFHQQLRDANRAGAKTAVAKVYGALFRVLSTETVASVLPRAAAILFDFGRVQASVAGTNCVRGTRSGVPHTLVAWTAMSSGAFIETTLENAGARAPRVIFGEPVEEGNVAGQATYEMPFDITWE